MQRWIPSVVALGIALLAWLAHEPGLDNGFVNYDDDLLILQSPALSAGLSPGSLRWALTSTDAANWFPSTRLSWLVDVELFGLDPAAFHRTNLLLHALTAGLLFLALLRLTGSRVASAGVATLFAVHPLHVESVAWAASRKDVLSGLFAVLALLAYERAVRCGERRWHAAVALALALGLGSKPVLVTLPFGLLLLDHWPLGRLGPAGSLDPRRIAAVLREKWALFALAFAASLVTYWTQSGAGAVQALERVPFDARLGNAVVALTSYLRKAFWPVDLAVFYPHPGLPAWQEWLAALAVLAGITLIALRQAGRRPALLVGWLWFVGMLLPVLGLVQVGQAGMADRYSYLPLIGVWIALGFGCADLPGRLRLPRPLVGAAALVVLVALVATTRDQTRYWRDTESLFRHALRVTADNHVAHINLGIDLSNRGRLDEASAHLTAGRRLVPGSPLALGLLGEVRLKQGRHPEALALFRAALAHQPVSARWQAGVGSALRAGGDATGAEESYREALARDPDRVDARIALGGLLLDRDAPEAALAELERALPVRPDSPTLHAYLGAGYQRRGDAERALSHFRRAVELAPAEGAYRELLAGSLQHSERGVEARAEYRAALERGHDSAALRNNLAWLLLEDGDPEVLDEALRHAEAAVAVTQSAHPGVLDTLAEAQARSAHWEDAVATAELALRLAREQEDLELVRRLEESLLRYRSRLAR